MSIQSGYKDTSRVAWRALKDTARLNQRQTEVMLGVHSHFAGRSFTRKELAAALGWPINCVTPRVGELISKNYLEEIPERREGGALVRVRWTQIEMFGGE